MNCDNMTINLSHPILYMLLLVLLSQVTQFGEAQPSGTLPPSPPDGYGFNTKFSPSMAIIIIVLICAFFFMGFFSIYLRQCADSSSTRGERAAVGGGARSRTAPKGLDPAVIETFPTFEYSVVKELKEGKGALECAVCLNEFEDDETLRLLPRCSHVFHPDCIDAWLSSHTTCPVCRFNLDDLEAQTSEAEPDPNPRPDTPPETHEPEAESLPHVAIDVDQAPVVPTPAAEVINPIKMPAFVRNRPALSKSSRRPPRFPRSHSTGHSLVQPGENVERFTLRLPEHVKKEIMTSRLHRTASCVAFVAEGGSVSGGSSRGGRWYRRGGGEGSRRGGGGEGSSRGGRSYRGEGSGRRLTSFLSERFDRLGRSDRWVFSKTPPFVARAPSFKSPRKAEGEQPESVKGRFPSVKTPFDCLGAKPETSEQESARTAAPVFTVNGQ